MAAKKRKSDFKKAPTSSPDEPDDDGEEKPKKCCCCPRFMLHVFVMAMMAAVAATPWGFLAFGSVFMVRDVPGLTLVKLGTFIPVFSGMSVLGTVTLPCVRKFLSPKMWLVLGSALVAGGNAIIIVLPRYETMCAGFVVWGLGFSIFTLVPYNQLGLMIDNPDQLASTFTKYQGFFNLGPAGGRLLMMATTIAIPGRLGWLLPFIVVAIASGALCVFAFLFGKFGPHQRPGQIFDKKEEKSYLQKARAFYCNKLIIVIIAAFFCELFAFQVLGSWGLPIAIARYPELEVSFVQGILSTLSAVSLPLGFLLATVGIQRSTTITRGLQYAEVYVALAVPAAFGLLLSGSNFYVFATCFALFISFTNYMWLFYACLPELLELHPDVTIFALSGFSLVGELATSIAGQFIPPFIFEEFGTETLIWITAGSAAASLVLWTIVVVWSCKNTGPVQAIRVKHSKAVRANAATGWQNLRQRLRVAAVMNDSIDTDEGSIVSHTALPQRTFKQTAQLVLIMSGFGFGVPPNLRVLKEDEKDLPESEWVEVPKLKATSIKSYDKHAGGAELANFSKGSDGNDKAGDGTANGHKTLVNNPAHGVSDLSEEKRECDRSEESETDMIDSQGFTGMSFTT